MNDKSQPEEAPESVSSRSRSVGFAALRHGDFALYLWGRNIGQSAVHMTIVAMTYQVYDVTGDPMNLAYIGLAMFAPAMLFALFTGYVADIYDRRKVMVACFCTMISSVVMFFAFTLSDMASIWPIYLIMFVLGTGRAFFNVVSSSFVPNLVPAEVFPNAVAWHQTAAKMSQVVGPAAGGGLYLFGPEVVYASAAALLALSIVLILLIKSRSQRRSREPVNLDALFAGLVYIWRKRIILGAIVLDLFVVLMGGVTALLPIFAKDILEVGPSGAGLLRSAMAVGGIAAALAMTRFYLTRNVGVILFMSVFLFGVGTVLFALSQTFVFSLAAIALMGASDMVSVQIRSTLLQIATPDEMRGRVSAVNSIFTGASNEIGDFRAGLFAAWIGAVGAAMVGGIGAVLITIFFWKAFPELGRVQRMDRLT